MGAQPLRSCLALCNHRDCSLPDAPVRAVLQREYWSGLPFPPLGDLPRTGIEPAYPLYPASCLDRQVLYHQCRLLFPWGSAFKVSFRDPEPKSFFCHHHSSHPSNYKQTNIKEKQTFKIVFHFLGFLIFLRREWSRSVVSDSLWPHGLSIQPTRLLRPWDSLGKNTGVGCHIFLQGIFLTQGLNPDLLHCG